MSWFQTYSDLYPNVQIDYQANGSGAGITAITERTVDFGASDAAMKDAEIAALPAGKKLFHFPTALGAVVDDLQPAGRAQAPARLGEHRRDLPRQDHEVERSGDRRQQPWRHPARPCRPRRPPLGRLRHDQRLHDLSRHRRPDLALERRRKGKDVKWPTGVGAAGNDGVATTVKQTPGAIGYVELNYATATELTSAFVKNADGQFVPGSTDGVTAAAEAAVADVPRRLPPGADHQRRRGRHLPDRLVHVPPRLPGPGQRDKGQAHSSSFIYWALTDGQATEAALGYAPLPKERPAEGARRSCTWSRPGGAPIWP